MSRIATLVVHYKVDKLTDKAVECLLAQTVEHDLYVIDNNSPVPYHNPDVRVLRRTDGSELASGLNWGMRQIGDDYTYVWHYTNDVTSPPETLASLSAQMDSDLSLAAIQSSMPSSHRHLTPQEGGCCKVRYVEWAAVLMRMDAWDDVGILDEGFNFFAMDIDWSYRARLQGWEVAVDRTVVCEHPSRGTHGAINFNISAQGQREHAHGVSKYQREDWQEYLLGK